MRVYVEGFVRHPQRVLCYNVLVRTLAAYAAKGKKFNKTEMGSPALVVYSRNTKSPRNPAAFPSQENSSGHDFVPGRDRPPDLPAHP